MSSRKAQILRWVRELRDSGTLAKMSGAEAKLILALIPDCDSRTLEAKPATAKLSAKIGIAPNKFRERRRELERRKILSLADGPRGSKTVCLLPPAGYSEGPEKGPQEGPEKGRVLEKDGSPKRTEGVPEKDPKGPEKGPPYKEVSSFSPISLNSPAVAPPVRTGDSPKPKRTRKTKSKSPAHQPTIAAFEQLYSVARGADWGGWPKPDLAGIKRFLDEPVVGRRLDRAVAIAAVHLAKNQPRWSRPRDLAGSAQESAAAAVEAGLLPAVRPPEAPETEDEISEMLAAGEKALLAAEKYLRDKPAQNFADRDRARATNAEAMRRFQKREGQEALQ